MEPLDTTPPDINIISPANGAVLPAKGLVSISAAASDVSGISRILIYVNNGLMKTCINTTSCQYNWNVAKVAAGSHTIRVQATDNAKPTSNTGSKSITVTKK